MNGTAAAEVGKVGDERSDDNAVLAHRRLRKKTSISEDSCPKFSCAGFVIGLSGSAEVLAYFSLADFLFRTTL